MSYRIDEMTYLGGLEAPCKERKDVTNEIHVGKWDTVSEYWTKRMKPIVDKIMKDVEEDYKKLSDPLDPPSEETMYGMRRVLEKGLTKNENKMEEKKTKKMTKAEAFEWLKCKKVDTCGHGEEVQKKLFECGFSWVNGHKGYYDFSDFLILDDEGHISHCGCRAADYWLSHCYESVSVEDILSLVINGKEKTMEEEALDEITELGKRISSFLSVLGGGHVNITVDDVTLYGVGMSLFHSDPF